MPRPATSRLWRLGARASDLGAAAALAGIAVLMVLDVGGRYLLNHPVPGAGEVIELAMAILVFSALPTATLRGEHVRLDYAEKLMPQAGAGLLRRGIDLFTALVLAFLAWRLAVKSLTIIRYGDTTAYLGWPIAPVAVFVAAVTAITAVLLAASALRPAPEAAAPSGPVP